MKSKLKIAHLLCGALFFTGCKTANSPNDSVNSADRKLADSILQFGLDREALYTILADIKPVSTLNGYTMPIAATDTTTVFAGDMVDAAANRKYLQKIDRIQRAIKTINIPDVKFTLVPFKSPSKKSRYMQLFVVRTSALDRLLKQQENFFSQYGFVPGSDAKVILTANEYGNRYERFRGYGYMFGYPKYAVDFYINSAKSDDEKKGFVKRNFFQIPTHKGKSGLFVYAYPTDYIPKKEVDSVLYHRSKNVLDKYEVERKKYLNCDGTLRSMELIRNFKN